MNTNLKELILNGLYKEVEKNIQIMNITQQSDALLEIAFDTENINVYTFIIFMLIKHESSSLQVLASQLLALPFCHLDGAYQAAVIHLKRAIELDPHNMDLQKYLLFFYEIPEPVIGQNEAREAAQRILDQDPSDQIAQNIFKS